MGLLKGQMKRTQIKSRKVPADFSTYRKCGARSKTYHHIPYNTSRLQIK